MAPPDMSKILSTVIKTLLIVGLFSYLIMRALRGSAFSELTPGSLNPSLLTFGFLLNLLATVITIIRWQALVKALDAQLSFSDALKFGFLGFMFNLSPIGIVGGDAIKTVLLVKKTEISTDRAVASVIIDRVSGLYAMFVLGLIVVLSTSFYQRTEPTSNVVFLGLMSLTMLTTVFLLFVVTPASKKNWRVNVASKVPFLGSIFQKLIVATLLYRDKKKTLFYSFLATFLVHTLFAASLYCFACGMFQKSPSFINHLILYCSANTGSMIPLSAGPFEYFLDELYPLFPIVGRACYEKGFGLMIGVVYRLATVGVALIGVVYYLFSRTDVRSTLQNSSDFQPKNES